MSAPTTRLFDLPLGAWFRYVGQPERTYVFLGHGEGGLVGDAPTTEVNRPFQGLYSAAESRKEFETMLVERVSIGEQAAKWIRVEDAEPKMYERVLVLTTDAEDDPHHSLAHYNGTSGFLGIGGHRLEPVTHWQRLDAPPADWKLPPPKPRNKSHRPAAKGKK